MSKIKSQAQEYAEENTNETLQILEIANDDNIHLKS
jgi:hypothetical protein